MALHWKQRLLAEYATNIQRHTRGQQAIHQLEDALQVLSSLGFPLHVEEGPEPVEPQPYPKVVFHLRAGSRVVQCEAELKELGPDWYFSMEEARYQAGVAKQYQRGGIFSKSLPAPINIADMLMPKKVVEPEAPKESARVVELKRRAKPKYQVPALIPGEGVKDATWVES